MNIIKSITSLFSNTENDISENFNPLDNRLYKMPKSELKKTFLIDIPDDADKEFINQFVKNLIYFDVPYHIILLSLEAEKCRKRSKDDILNILRKREEEKRHSKESTEHIHI